MRILREVVGKSVQFVLIVSVVFAIPFLPSRALAQQAVPTAAYQVRIFEVAPPRVSVHATVPIDGTTLTMATSRPGDIPEVADAKRVADRDVTPRS
jgi:hypothetical protein